MSEEEIIILEELKKYLQEKIDNGIHKLFYEEAGYEFKTIDAINAINNLQQENKQLKQQLKNKNEKISNISTKLKKIKQKYNLMALTTTGTLYDLAHNIHDDLLEILESEVEINE